MEKYEQGELRKFKDFTDTMAELTQLKRVDEERRPELLRELYEFAVDRRRVEREAQNEKDLVPEVRANRKRSTDVIRLLETAYQAVKKARASNPDLLTNCEKIVPHLYKRMNLKLQRPDFTFADMVRNLVVSHFILDAGVTLGATEVPTRLHTEREKRLASESLERFPGALAKFRSTVPNFALTKKPARALDTQLIRDAATCIDKYRPSGTSSFPGRDMIIMRLFEAAFGDKTRSQASIQKALRRRKAAKRTAVHTPTPAHTASC